MLLLDPYCLLLQKQGTSTKFGFCFVFFSQMGKHTTKQMGTSYNVIKAEHSYKQEKKLFN